MSRLAALIIVLMPFHAFLTVWASSLVGHYTLLRLWKEFVLAGLCIGALYLVIQDKKLRFRLLHDRLLQLIFAYGCLLLLVTLFALWAGTVTPKAAAYGLLLDSRLLLFFIVTAVTAHYSDLLVRAWRRLLLIPAAITVGFATLQYAALPSDVLSHFGYGPASINPVATVDQKNDFQRVQSTLRGPNPFGTYLILVLAALGTRLIRFHKSFWQTAAFFILSLLALFFTFSRSAWIGVVFALLWLLWQAVTSPKTRKLLIVASAATLVLAAGAMYGLRNNDYFQNVFFHTNEHSLASESSNTGHFTAIKEGLVDTARQPWGRGIGTAGPASAYNSDPARISENYYIQIGQEAGVLGAGLFIAITVVVMRRLHAVRQHELARVLLASFIGILAVNMLSHAWVDDTIAYMWWGFAGAMLGLGTQKEMDG